MVVHGGGGGGWWWWWFTIHAVNQVYWFTSKPDLLVYYTYSEYSSFRWCEDRRTNEPDCLPLNATGLEFCSVLQKTKQSDTTLTRVHAGEVSYSTGPPSPVACWKVVPS
jgi:hypothetical protein